MRFSYQATDIQGARIYQGVVEAGSAQEARRRIREMGLYPLRVTPERRGRWPRPPLGELVLFTEALATMVEAGIPLTQALEALSLQSRHPTLRQAARGVRAGIEAGASFSQALAQYPEAFPPLMVRLVAAGELGGALEETLRRLARYLDRLEELNQKVKTALLYPALVVAVVVLAVLVLLLLVIPAFERLFLSTQTPLPLPTRLLLGASLFLRAHGPWLLLLLALLAYALGRYRKTERGAYYLDRLLLRLPLVGPLVHKAEIARFGRALATLYASGVNINQALEAVRPLVNAYIARALEGVARGVLSGRSLAALLRQEEEVFLPVFVQMAAFGEETGKLDGMLDRAAEHLEREVEYATKRLASSLEPLLILILGALVAFVALSLYLPLFDLPRLLIRP